MGSGHGDSPTTISLSNPFAYLIHVLLLALLVFPPVTGCSSLLPDDSLLLRPPAQDGISFATVIVDSTPPAARGFSASVICYLLRSTVRLWQVPRLSLTKGAAPVDSTSSFRSHLARPSSISESTFTIKASCKCHGTSGYGDYPTIISLSNPFAYLIHVRNPFLV